MANFAGATAAVGMGGDMIAQADSFNFDFITKILSYHSYAYITSRNSQKHF